MTEQQETNKSIVVLDDETDILELISLYLRKAEFTPVTFDNVSDFWTGLDNVSPALIVLDLMLPGSDGYEICRQLRHGRHAQTPIVMLTAREKEVDRILGLELGADDYITKPFSPRELVARIRAILRRTSPDEEQNVLEFDNSMLRIDLNSYEVEVKDRKIALTATEFRLLSLLVGKKNWVFSREQILEHLWGNRKNVIDRTVDVHIKNLREKLGNAGKYIKNVRGVGYKFAC